MSNRTPMAQKTTGLVKLAGLVAAFVFLILLSNTFLQGMRLDLTENGLYSVSDGTSQILNAIDQPLTLQFFFSDEATRKLPSTRIYANRVREMLEEYVQRAGGMIELQIIDPLPFSEEEDQAANYGLQPMQAGRVTGSVYFGLAGTNDVGDVVIVPAFQQRNEQFLEYDLTKLVYTLSHPQQAVIGLLSELPLAGGWNPATRSLVQPWAVYSAISEMFEILQLSKDSLEIGEDIDVLMLVHPKRLSENALYSIDQFVLRGGRLIVFVDPLAETDTAANDSQNPFNDSVGEKSSDIPELFAAWGVQFDPGLVVVDRQLALAVNTGGSRTTEHIGMLGLGDAQLNDADVLTGLLSSINIGLAGHFTLADDATTTLQPLLSTTDDSALLPISRFFYLQDPNSLRDDFEPSGKSFVIAARLSGQVDSAFGETPPASQADIENAHLAKSTDSVNIILVGDADMLANHLWIQVSNFFGQSMLSKFANNGDFVANALDNLGGNEALISIRGRASFSRPFEKVETLRHIADEQFRAKEQELQAQLDETEKALDDLQAGERDDQVLIISDEQRAQIEQFVARRSAIRKELRLVRHNLDRSIEKLGRNLRLINIALVPLLITLLTLALIVFRRRRL
ncbi:MAG: Gldg family protein [Gammaproteobacteria bacterium]|nr:Gldg family protein [Gammaproteobacteria bacterium]